MIQSNNDAHSVAEKEVYTRHVCTNCGYVYDSELGDPLNDVPSGTSFEQLAVNWKCPLCEVEKDRFDPLD